MSRTVTPDRPCAVPFPPLLSSSHAVQRLAQAATSSTLQYGGRALSQAVSRRPLTLGARVQFQVSGVSCCGAM